MNLIIDSLLDDYDFSYDFYSNWGWDLLIF
jgi:hypothetical protein